MKIKSINDVITNSSDEVYIIKSNKTAQEIYDDLVAHKNSDERRSGMGGILTVKTCDDFVGNDEDYYSSEKLPKGVAELTIDQGFCTLLEYVRNLHNESLETVIYLKSDVDWMFQRFDNLNYESIKDEDIDLYPELRDNFKKLVDKITKIYENKFKK